MLLCAVWMCKLHLESKATYCYIMAVSVGSAMTGENIECLLLCLLCQPGEKLCCVRLCYGCCVSQEIINMSAVSAAL